MGPSRLIAAVFVALVLSVPAPVFAADDASPYSAVVIQNRKHDPTHEFTVGVGMLPLDAFRKSVTASGAYTLHFTPHFAWEVAQFYYSFHYDTSLNAELEAFDLQPTPFEVLDFFLMSNFLYKPLYYKGSWNNRSLVYGEIYLAAGGGYGWFTRSSKPGIDLGIGFRLYAGKVLSFKFDVRYNLFFNEQIFENFQTEEELHLGLGTSLSF